MTEILEFFKTMSTVEKAVWLFGCLGLTMLIEAGLPFHKRPRQWAKHNSVNLVFLVFTFLINAVFGIFTIGLVYPLIEQYQFGLLYLVDLPVWVELGATLLIFDLVGQYYVHYVLHHVGWLWRFHMIHHSDTQVVASTGTRHHPGDYIMRELFALATIVALGAPFAFYMVYRMLTIPFTYINHANIVVPRWLDLPLSFIFVTPNVHKFHHHFKAPWTDSNFGNIFSFWDRIFGTLVYDDPMKIEYGLDVLDPAQDENIAYQLKIPFNRKIPTSLTNLES